MRNIVLIGMPGVGKSTVGVLVAKRLGYSFIDTDLILQSAQRMLLPEIISKMGVEGFIALENKTLCALQAENSVIATGGSAVYGAEAMENLRRNGTVVYLRLDPQTLCARVGDIQNRGVVTFNGSTIFELYKERAPLYEKYADIIIDETGCDIEATVQKIVTRLKEC